MTARTGQTNRQKRTPLRRAALAGVFGLSSLGLGCADSGSNTPPPVASLNTDRPTPSKGLPASNPSQAYVAQQTAVVSPAPRDPVIARIDDVQITQSQLWKPLIETYGLNTLMNQVRLEMARSAARKQGVTVSTEDIDRERQRTLLKLFPQLAEQLERSKTDADRQRTQADLEKALDQLLTRENSSRAQFAVIIETNAWLRKLAEPVVYKSITEQTLQARFNLVYGELLVVRHIQVPNLQLFNKAKQRLQAGESFDVVAREMSTSPSKSNTPPGQLKPFNANTPGLPKAFVDAAYALKPGELSDPVGIDQDFHLLMLVERRAPKVVKFDDVKESLREDLTQEALDSTVKLLRDGFAERVKQELKIDEPVMAGQFAEKKREEQATVQNRDRLRQQVQEQNRPSTAPSSPATAPANPANPANATTGAAPAPAPATAPAAAPARPAATPASTSPAEGTK